MWYCKVGDAVLWLSLGVCCSLIIVETSCGCGANHAMGLGFVGQ